MFGFNQKKLRKTYDEMLLSEIDIAKQNWDHAKQTQMAVFDADDELIAETQLAQAKFRFLYQEARLRQVKGRLQSSVIDY